MSIASAFWQVVTTISAPMGLASQIATINAFNNTELADAIDQFNIVMDKIYYFIPKELLYPLIGIAIASIMIRIGLAVINLIWW